MAKQQAGKQTDIIQWGKLPIWNQNSWQPSVTLSWSHYWPLEA